MFDIKKLCVSIDGKEIVRNFSISIRPGEVHAIMGPNGSGKSTLSKAILGDPRYSVDSGEIVMNNEDVLPLAPEDRAVRGIFIGLQYPVEIPGVSNSEFIRMAYNAKMKFQNQDALDPLEFKTLLQKKAEEVGLDASYLSRSVNHGFSGGEKKRNEILQMAVLEPQFVVLDEIDSGLDIDAMKSISKSVNNMRSENRSFLIITHYKRLLDLIRPDFVHVMTSGRILKSGDLTIADELECDGYGALLEKPLNAEALKNVRP